MKRAKPILLAGLSALFLAQAQFAWAYGELRDDAHRYELVLKRVTMPVTPNGQVQFRTCDTCDLMTMPVTLETRYILDERDVTHEAFIEEVRRIRLINGGDERTFVGVAQSIETDLVMAIVLVIPQRG